MAAEALEAAAQRAGVEIAVETQGSAGSTPLDPSTIAAADAVIFATDVGVKDRRRFAGKPMVACGVKRAIDDADGMIGEALAYADEPVGARASRAAAAGAAGAATRHGGGGNESWGLKIRRVLMTGVSYMIPFVAAGGLLIALSFLLGGYEIVGPGGDIVTGNTLFDLPDSTSSASSTPCSGSPFFAYLGAVFFAIGGAAFKFLVPALAGYIAYAIADRPGIAPGFVMGAIAGTAHLPASSAASSAASSPVSSPYGSRGGRYPTWARGLMPVVVIPLLRDDDLRLHHDRGPRQAPGLSHGRPQRRR